MINRRILSLLLSLCLLLSLIPANVAMADKNPTERTVYLHAQGSDPKETVNVSTVYMGDTTELYFSVDNPNKGIYENNIHKEPQYDMNGYTVKIYFDPVYFAYATDSQSPMDYTVPDTNVAGSGSGSEDVGNEAVPDVPQQVGYFPYKHGSDSKTINGKIYKAAYLTVFFSGGYVPQKKAGQIWYNLCKLPLIPQKTGSTEVFLDVSGQDPYTLELFAKNQSDQLSDQTFLYQTINGGRHQIVIKDKLKPMSPQADPSSGSYTTAQTVTLTAESDSQIYYSTDGGKTYQLYTKPIEVDATGDIICYAKRTADGKESDKVTYSYEILPTAPFLFDSDKTLLPNIYNEKSAFTVYAADKEIFGAIADDSEIYYTFDPSLPADNILEGNDPSSEWVKLVKSTQSIEITETCTLRLMTGKKGEWSDVATYYLGIQPAAVISSHVSGKYDTKIDVTLSTETKNAEIYYTTDGSNPITNGLPYTVPITLAKDTTLRAVAKYNGTYSDIASFYYLFTFYDDYGVDAFYPSGVYEGSVNVTLTANNPAHKIVYSTDGGVTWQDYTDVLVLDQDTEILAKSVDQNGVEGDSYHFTYKIKPLPPAFAPESTQFTNADNITVFCSESTQSNTGRFELYYTIDGSDPITSPTSIKADEESDSAIIEIKGYTVVSAVVKKDGTTYSNVVTHSYDIVTKKPVKPITTLLPGDYTRQIGDTEGFWTQFMPVPAGTEIYYTISYDGAFCSDPVPGDSNTLQYDGTSIAVKGRTTIKAIAVNVFGVKSDIGIFDYTVTPESPETAPSAEISGNRLPVVPVEAVIGSTVHYTIGKISNSFVCEDGNFYLDTQTGNAYRDEACTQPLGNLSNESNADSVVLDIWAELHGVTGEPNRYIYTLSDNAKTLAPPYADQKTGTYPEMNIDGQNHLLLIRLYSLNSNATIQYMLDNSGIWLNYDGNPLKLKEDTVMQLRAERDGYYSSVVSYVYHFVPLPPIITLPSGRYAQNPVPTTTITLDPRAPTDKNYSIWYRANGEKMDVRYMAGVEREIPHTMSFKAYVRNDDTQVSSSGTIHYYIIEPNNAATGTVYIANPYDVERISADVLTIGSYAEGIKLLTQNKNAQIHYFYSYRKTDGTGATTNNYAYDNAAPILVNATMDNITITAWLEDANGRIPDSENTFFIDFIHLGVPVTSLGSDKLEFSKGTKYTLHDLPTDENTILYYTLDGSDPTNSPTKRAYVGETLSLDAAVTVKAVYYSACGKCVECKNNNKEGCWNGVYGKTGVYRYTVPTVKYSGGGGGGGTTTIDKTRKYTIDIFGTEHPTHIGYIKGYPDGSVQPNGMITREEIAAILHRVRHREYEEPFTITGKVFPDVSADRWSVADIEYMANEDVIIGYEDGTFRPARNLTRAEFAALIRRFTALEGLKQNHFQDVQETHWAYGDILALYAAGLIEGYEDGTFRPENPITRAEVMTVVNKLLGRKPAEAYVKSLNFNPFHDLAADQWYYVIVLEATITHNYYLDDKTGYEIKWEDCK